MNPFLIEQKRIELLSLLPSLHGRTKLWIIADFYTLILSFGNESFTNAFSTEFIDELLNELDNYNSFYKDPVNTEKLLLLLEQLRMIKALEFYLTKIDQEILKINDSFKIINRILEGEKILLLPKISYPLIETNEISDNQKNYGILETIKVKIGKSKDSDSFLYIPSQQKTDDKLEQQARNSFKLALNYLSSFSKKFSTYHEILIYFENRSANYEGNSLGIALTIAFIEQLTIYYNLPYQINIKENITSTGGIDPNGNVLPVSEKHIKQKVETVFFSPIEHFVIPAQDEIEAIEKLKTLKEKYPNRNLKLTPIENIQDLLDRRSLIDIKKQSHLIRSARSIRKNWKISLVTLLLFSLMAFIAIRDFDDNPAIIEFHANHLVLKNKSGKFLWEKELDINQNKQMSSQEQKQLVRLIDINNDGFNEVLICSEKFNNAEKSKQTGRICCFDNKGEILWSYRFNETIKTTFETFKDNYFIQMIDTLTENRRKVICLFANYEMLYPSVIFKIDLLTGKRLEGGLWNPGTIYSAIIKDIDKDGQNEIIAGCVNNAIKLPCIFSIKTNKLFGTNYSTNDYKFIGMNSSQLDNCLFLPKTDYSIYKREYINQFSSGTLVDNANESKLMFNIREGNTEENAVLVYKLAYDFKNIDIIVNSNLRVRRDSLVAKGILKMPFTDTKEYTEMLKSQILIWDRKQILKRNE